MMHDPKLMDCPDLTFALSQYGESWKRQRRLLTHYLNPRAVTHDFSSTQIASVHALLKRLLNNPADLRKHVTLSLASTILGIAYGYDVQLEDDPFIRLSTELVMRITEAFTPKYLVNSLPLLSYIPSWMPGAGFKTSAIKAKKVTLELIEQPYRWSKEQTATGGSRSSFVQNALNELTDPTDSTKLEDIKKVAATMYAAGAEATTAVVYDFILQMILNPYIQRRAQAELDTVIGSPDSPSFRLPTFKDRSQLPYIEALMKESLRWHPSAPSGAPHVLMEEDEYRGWRIPKGSIIVPNAWGMLRDEKLYTDPYTFSPERFLATKERPAEPDSSVCGVFGFGKRSCPGRLLAENSIWLEIANLLAAFNFAPAKDSKGNDIDVRFALKAVPGFVLDMPEFPCSVTPRSKHIEKVINYL